MIFAELLYRFVYENARTFYYDKPGTKTKRLCAGN
jgi:hypothetical protein